MHKYKKNILLSSDTLKKALTRISNLKIKNLIIVDNNFKFIGFITDGDIRRFIVKKKLDLNTSLKIIANKKCIYINSKNALVNKTKLYREGKFFLIPKLNKFKKLVDILYFKEDLSLLEKSKVAVLVLAGGQGERLRPLTIGTPKPLLKINTTTVIDLLLQHIFSHRFEKIHISVNYHADMIINHLKNRYKKKSLIFLKENTPLGTAGPVRKINLSKFEDLVLVNGDIITKIDLGKFLNYHKKNKFDVTIAAISKKIFCDYGVLKIKGNKLEKIIEKPVFKNLINSGIYIIKSDIAKKIPKNKYFNMPDFLKKITICKSKIGIYKFDDYWADIGNFSELDRVRKEFEN